MNLHVDQTAHVSGKLLVGVAELLIALILTSKHVLPHQVGVGGSLRLVIALSQVLMCVKVLPRPARVIHLKGASGILPVLTAPLPIVTISRIQRNARPMIIVDGPTANAPSRIVTIKALQNVMMITVSGLPRMMSARLLLTKNVVLWTVRPVHWNMVVNGSKVQVGVVFRMAITAAVLLKMSVIHQGQDADILRELRYAPIQLKRCVNVKKKENVKLEAVVASGIPDMVTVPVIVAAAMN